MCCIQLPRDSVWVLSILILKKNVVCVLFGLNVQNHKMPCAHSNELKIECDFTIHNYIRLRFWHFLQ